MHETLVVNEIYLSLQGESTFAGLPCIFIRLTACNLRCSYCDTAYAFTEGEKKTLEEICGEVDRLAARFETAKAPDSGRLPLIELTGGEPLLQKNVLPLMRNLCDEGFTVLLESSGEVERNRWSNLEFLKSTDEIKFVIGTVKDYAWMKEQIKEHALDTICPLLVSWVHPLSAEQQNKSLKKMPEVQTSISRQALAEKIIADALSVRFQAQLHKIIWSPEQRGV